MTTDRAHLQGLVQLPRLAGSEERRSSWRQAMATLSALVTNRQHPVPLEGLDPAGLLEGTRVARDDGLLDDLSWLSPPAAAAALYELATALPPSELKRELGRHVLTRLYTGDAATFVALATQLALGSRRALSGTSVRARVALALDLPLGLGARADALALALISRQELQREWLAIPSTGSLPARRLAARLLERAAREAGRRAALGDEAGVRVFETEQVRTASRRLLADRESLVWRHVATARGLLASELPEIAETLELHVDPTLTPTEWRRAATSLAAHIAIEPQAALARCRRLLGSEVPRRDPGVPGAMMFGLPRAAEARPGEATELLDQIVRTGGLDAAQALVDLRRERLGDEFAREAAEVAREGLRAELRSGPVGDDGRVALLEAVIDELGEGQGTESRTLHAELEDALAAFADHGAAEAHQRAKRLLTSVESRLGALEATHDDGGAARRSAFRAMRELDATLFATDTLANLLTLGTRDGAVTSELRTLADAFERTTNWLVLREYGPVTAGNPVPHFQLRMARLRTLLHLVDADGPHLDDRTELRRKRRLVTTQLMLHRVRDDAENALRRALCATTARACDALVREELAEVSDVLLVTSAFVHDPQDLQTLSEASMVPEIESVLRSYARMHRTVASAPRSGRGVRMSLDVLAALARELPVATSPRVEALRSTLLALDRALEDVAAAPSLRSLAAGTEERLMSPLEAAIQHLAELASGARRRLEIEDRVDPPSSGSALRLLDLCVERAVRGEPSELGEALGSAAEALQAELPGPIAELVLLTLERIWQLPLDSEESHPVIHRAARPRAAPLPPWVPPSRTLGGFYVLHPIGSGSGGSVFVARRVHERDDPHAERFALKVPEYDGTAARTLSENEFLRLFRDEATALLALPEHPNIARFVTFDAGARPKPVLVMELVEGPSLERVLEMGDLDMARALGVVDDIAAGLEAMHAAGVGHLDVKPGNVILRDPDGIAGPVPPGTAVLVDLGLAGHHIRPGCATANYGAPEIWGASESTDPRPADVYAFACIVYEVLTSRTLFTGPHEMALITAHLQHQGTPPGIAALGRDPRTQGLAELLSRALHPVASERLPIGELRRDLASLAGEIGAIGWPLEVPDAP